MEVFEQTSKEHINKLNKLLDIETAKENAVALAIPKERNGTTYTKCIRIDFIGIAATRLFDVVSFQDIYNQLVCIIRNVEALNKEGYFVKIRLLFEYPYSVSAYTRIQAEHAVKRASITEREFIRGVSLNDTQIDNEKFWGSAYVRTQKRMLIQIQELLDKLPLALWNNKAENKTMNTFTIRFAPIQTYMRCLIINNDLFFDVYTLAKEKCIEDRCKQFCPIVHLTHKDDNSTFLAFEDHFRYIWDLDVTMDCEDATEYKAGISESLSRIKSPDQVKYTAKLQRLQSQNPDVTNKEDFKVWQSRITKIMNRFCANLYPTPASESIFISCSWEKNSPKKLAQELYNDLHKDLCNKVGIPVSSVKILNADLGKLLAPELYRTMEDATIGIVILTKDIKSEDNKFFSKPNVYHELGYMMHHLTREKTMILAEDGVEIPSNIQDIIKLNFTTDKLCLRYADIIDKIQTTMLLDEQVVLEIKKSYLNRMNEKLKNGIITQEEYKSVEQKVGNTIKVEKDD